MKRRRLAQSAVALVLLFLVGVLAARVADRGLGWRVDLGARDAGSLETATREFLAGVDDPIHVTFFVSSPDAMPSEMRDIERSVRSLLDALRSAAPEKVDFRVIDPDRDPPHGASYASRHGVSPVKLRRVVQDADSEQSVWSSMVLGFGARPETLIQAIGPRDLPYLERLIVEHLRALREPEQAVVGIAAPEEGFRGLAAIANERVGARVVTVDLDSGEAIPPEVDVLFWIRPAAAREDSVREVRRFLASGRPVVLGGSGYTIESAPDGASFDVRPATCDWNELLRAFGLRMSERIVLDESHGATATRGADGGLRLLDAPFQVRVLPSQYHTKLLLGHASGALLTSETSVLLPEPDRLAAAGRQAEILATTSEKTRLLDPPEGLLRPDMFDDAEPVPKQPLMMLLRPDDPWQGDLLVIGSTGLFRDEIMLQGGNANAVFLRTLLRTFTAPERLARNRVARIAPEPLPPTSAPQRFAWRVVVVFLLPGVLLVAGFRGRTRLPHSRRVLGWAFAGTLAWLALIGVTYVLGASGPLALPRADLTAGRINTPSPLLRTRLARMQEGLSVELLISDAVHRPPSFATLEDRVRTSLRGLGLRPRTVRPEDLPPAAVGELRASGVAPFRVDSVRRDTATAVPVWSALRLTRGGRAEVIPRLTPRTLPHLEFLLAAALERLETGRTRHVAVLSDLPRLTPAEAHMDYQQKGYVAPVGSDVYSDLKQMLLEHGYRVTYINPKTPEFPADIDLLLWLQPRFPFKTIPAFSEHMAGGGKAIVAVQHYNVQQRQYRGDGFRTVYWPQPQFHRFNGYLEPIGVRQIGEKRADEAGEILFDSNFGSLPLETQVNRSAFREFDPQQVARPFLIRAMGGGLSDTSLITSRLGELMFIWGSRFVLDAETLAREGLTAEPLVTTSDRAWTYAWTGGWIPEEAFAAPEDPEDYLPGPQVLSVLMSGTFPAFEMVTEEGQRPALRRAEPDASPNRRPGELLLIGCSEMFKNGHLSAEGRQHDRFLLNAVARLAHGEELAALQARQPAPDAFAARDPRRRATLRTAVILLPPLLLLLYAAVRRRIRRRPVLAS